MDMEDVKDNTSKTQRLLLSIQYFWELCRDGHLSGVLIRVAIFICFVVLTHTIMIWSIHNIAIPLAKRYFMDRMLDEMQVRLSTFEFNGYRLSDYDVEIDF